MGRPAVFVRLSGCVPPFCPWCDTQYAREPGQKLKIENVLAQVLAFQNGLVVITGGEPFLQWDTGLKILEDHLLRRGCTLQYETSGKVEIPRNTRGYKVCSPKLIDDRWYFDSANVQAVDAFKFVVKDEFDAIETFIKEYEIPGSKVWLMPRGTMRHEQLGLFRAVWEFCVEKKFNFSPRLHILAFNDQRGV